MKIGIIQHQNDPVSNQAALSLKVKQLADQGAELVVLQELHDYPYFCQTEMAKNFDFAEGIPGTATAFYSKVAQENKVVLVSSLFEKRAPGLYHNTAVVFEKNGEIAGTYRKMHIPDDPGYYEKFYFTPGDLGFEPISTSVGKLGVMVCWDQWYPEAARIMALKGADLLIYPTAIGWDPMDSEEEKNKQLNAWVTIQKSHAIANGVPVVVVNRVGHEQDPSGHTNGIDFWGHSFVAGPQGETLKELNHTDAAIGFCELSKEQSETVRRAWPFLRDRRIEEYASILKRFDD